jgi:uncharacterized repeat protein (TIGR03803 family)
VAIIEDEREIREGLKMLVCGGVKRATVAWHMRNIFEKLQVHSKSEAVAKAPPPDLSAERSQKYPSKWMVTPRGRIAYSFLNSEETPRWKSRSYLRHLKGEAMQSGTITAPVFLACSLQLYVQQADSLSRKTEITYRGRRRATLETAWWRRFGGLCLQLCLILAATAMASSAQNEQDPHNVVTFTTLLNFDLPPNGFGGPPGALVQGGDGNLYGVTNTGGANVNNPVCVASIGPSGGCGTFFKVTPSGALTTLYSFCSETNCADGGLPPDAGLVLGTDGNFYGITALGGANGAGTVFKITPSGTLTTLYNWCSQPNCADGFYGFFPNPNMLVQATDGNFYGTNEFGGNSTFSGTFFKLTPTGSLTTLYSFCSQPNCTDGQYAFGLIQATDGNFYGTTYGGGANGWGTAYKITPSGTLTTLYNFCSQGTPYLCSDGAIPYAALIQGADGNFYGSTSAHGAFNGGTVFKMTASGTLTTLHNFCSQHYCPDGNNLSSALVQATDGNFYGPAAGGGNHPCSGFFRSCGTVFKITPEGTMTTLHMFDQTDGSTPLGLFQATNGTLYGTTLFGGTCGSCGTVFTLSLGLGPFVETVPPRGSLGAPVTILGTDLTGATSVRFNGKEAAFTVVSQSEITTTVPPEAHTGFVTVHTPSGTLKSNVPFQLLP